jgi:hypothetical protein
MNQLRARRREGGGGGVLARAREGFPRKKRPVRPIFLFCEVKYAKLLEMSSFFPPYIILGVGKHHDLGNEKCQTVGDALRVVEDERRGGPDAAPARWHRRHS